jgi:D-psicose/D-tagatose/L-ribulose 3-epimerase
LPGNGTVDWDEVFGALKEIEYKGPLVLEAFAETNPDLVGGTCLWRRSQYTPREIASRDLEFLKQKANAFSL